MAKILECDKLKLLLEEDGFRYYLFTPTFLRVYPKSGNMRKMTVMQTLRFLVMKMNGHRMYIMTDLSDEILTSIAFSSGSQYRFPFAGKDDLIYGPSYTMPEHRGCGYAVKLWEKVESRFEKDTKTFYATIRDDNPASIRCMEKSGFETIGKLKGNKITRAFEINEAGDHVLVKYER